MASCGVVCAECPVPGFVLQAKGVSTMAAPSAVTSCGRTSLGAVSASEGGGGRAIALGPQTPHSCSISHSRVRWTTVVLILRQNDKSGMRIPSPGQGTRVSPGVPVPSVL